MGLKLFVGAMLAILVIETMCKIIIVWRGQSVPVRPFVQAIDAILNLGLIMWGVAVLAASL